MLCAICHAHRRLVSISRMRWWLWSELTLKQNLLRSRLSSESKLLWLLTYPESYLRFWNRKLRLSARLSSNMSHNLLSGIPHMKHVILGLTTLLFVPKENFAWVTLWSPRVSSGRMVCSNPQPWPKKPHSTSTLLSPCKSCWIRHDIQG